MAQIDQEFHKTYVMVKMGVAAVVLVVLVVVTVFLSTHRPKADKPGPATATHAPAASPAPPSSSSSPGRGTSRGIPAQSAAPAGQAMRPAPTTPMLRDYAPLAGVMFTDRPDDARRLLPTVNVIDLRIRSANYAVWGATGRDHLGRVYVGVSADERTGASAQLVQYDPLADKVIDLGVVTQKLAQAGQTQRGAGQSKLHSRIVQGADGYLYFSSMDDEGSEDESITSAYLWRMKPPQYAWEPLFKSSYALIAVAGFGTDIYALGDPGHVLHHYDTLTGEHRHVTVGTVPGHISRNLVVDARGHAYVPRLTPGLLPGDPPRVELVQFNRQLRQIAATPLDHYLTGRPADSHGIIASTALADRSLVLATHHGRLYHITPSATGQDQPAVVKDLGWFHPAGARYTPTLHTIDGARYLVGVTKVDRPAAGQPAFEWLTYDLWFKESHAQPLDIPQPQGHNTRNLLLYGSMTRDAAGRFYIAGVHLNARQPMLVQLTLP